jgi:hypothetical protein
VLNAPLKGWTRFPAAQAWLDQHSITAASETRRKFDLFLAAQGSQTRGLPAATPEQNEALFQQFLQWQQETSAARAPASASARKRQ